MHTNYRRSVGNYALSVTGYCLSVIGYGFSVTDYCSHLVVVLPFMSLYLSVYENAVPLFARVLAVFSLDFLKMTETGCKKLFSQSLGAQYAGQIAPRTLFLCSYPPVCSG